ncbi:MAG: Gfo/Idh/MocA family oxidoreductase [Planctomycetes bacterium]|nr:Gfo/Idh/MocA family oxidoreductase [Planctomycetota bacterium]
MSPSEANPTTGAAPQRRDLLRSTAALVGMAALGACTSAQADKRVARAIPKARRRAPVEAGAPLRLGLIGPGGMGSGHVGGLLDARAKGREKLDLVAVADVCKPRVEGAAQTCRDAQPGVEVAAYRDWRELIARDDLHGVLIATPEHWHVPMAVAAIEAGLDVYVEKPLCIRHEDALHLADVVAANDRILQVGTQYMMYPKYGHARALIAAGEIGHPTLSQTSYCRNSKEGEWLYGIDESIQPGELLDWEEWCGPEGVAPWDPNVFFRWRRFRKWSTGIVGDLLPHQMTPLLYALDVGWPVRVGAIGGHYADKAMENHDHVVLTIEFEKQHTMLVVGSTCNESGLEQMIRGHRANLLLGGNNCVLKPERVYSEEVDEQNITCAGMDPQDSLRLDWMSSMRTRAANRSPVGLAAQAMVIIDLATRSLWDGRTWTFDPQTRSARPA